MNILNGLSVGFKYFGRGLAALGRGTIALVGICGVVAALANYTMTQGAGTTFASVVISTVHYAASVICDATAGGTQCAAVDSSGNVSVKDAAVLAAVQSAVPAGTNLIGKVGIDQTAPGTTNGVQVNAALPAGTNLIGKTGIDQTTPGSTNAVSLVPGGSGGWTKFSTPKNNSNTALTTTVVAVKSSAAGIFGGYFISNPNATVACLQVFDVATAGAVTLGTTRPDLVFCIPATSGANLELANGAAMASGIQIAAATTASGNTAPSTGLDVTVLYK